ncbi:hypothetical protein [Pseudomonas sp. RIT623]|uniref:hypothetical protein n=1 Tax=Pseudomonas sp. RIT623 TaxID=2559075 RepID=UPI0010705922|nr:hypothetical protein [Pseudomonas sp. RIT623]TFF41662.1 hypothetical protein E3U47_07885 [Pseudomonas sp. RIT623]
MVRNRPLAVLLALAMGLASTASFAATDMHGGSSHSEHSSGDQPKGKTAGEDGSVNAPGGGRSNDSNDTGSGADAADGAAGGSNSTGEATGSGAGASGGTAEDQDSR